MSPAVRVILSLVLAVAGVAALQRPAMADSSIRIKVDDQPITTYDIAQRTRLLQLTGAKGGEKAAIEELIDETLQFIEAARRGISVPDSRVDQAIASIGAGMKLSPDQLKQALAQQGVNIATLRRRIKSQMVWQQLVQAKIRLEGTVKSSDVTAALFQDGGADKLKVTEFTLQQIVFVVPSGSSAAFVAQRRREAEAFRGRYPGCEQALGQAKLLKGVVIRSLGRRTSDQLGGGDGKAVMNTPAGRTTPPIKTEQGIELIAVCSTRELNSDAAARSEVEMKLMMEKNKDLGKDYLANLRKKAVIEYR